MHLEGPLQTIWMESLGYGKTLLGGHDRQRLGSTGKCAACALRREREYNCGPTHRLVIFIFDTHDGLTRRPLPDIINGAFALHNHNV
jgi:hypothetical protein